MTTAPVDVAEPDLVDPDTEDDEPLEAHFILRTEHMYAMVEGVPVKALCGKIWVPSRNPENLPVCQMCVEKRDEIRRMRGQ